MSKTTSARFRRPTADEQHVLKHLTVRWVRPEEVPRYDALMSTEHYLKNARVVGEHLRYVTTYRGPRRRPRPARGNTTVAGTRFAC